MKIKLSHLLLGLSLTIPLVLVQCNGQGSKVHQLKWPPNLSDAIEKAEAVSYCDLVRNPGRFNNTIVRVQALFHKNLENSVFSDETCKDSFTWVEFDPAYVYSDDALKNKFAALTCLKQARCDGSARVSVVGRFEGPSETGYGHLGCCPYRFSIMRIERAEAVLASISSP